MPAKPPRSQQANRESAGVIDMVDRQMSYAPILIVTIHGLKLVSG